MVSSVILPDGELYCCTKSNKQYISLNYHRSYTGRKGKSFWKSSISRKLEFEIFYEADDKNWQDYRGNYWGVLNNGLTIIGRDEERLCKFPHNPNPNVPWHGFPVSPAESVNDTPPTPFVKKWEADKVISRRMAYHIIKRNI